MYRSSSIGRRGAPWVLGVGVVQLVLGLFFIVGLGGIPYAGFGMVLTGAILVLVGVVLLGVGVVVLRKAEDSDRISATGLAGVGQIMGVTQTGMMVNYQPVIEVSLLVTVPGRAPYPARVRGPVPLILLNRLQGSLPVRVDPARPDRVVIQWDRLDDPSAFAVPVAAVAAMPTGAAPIPASSGPAPIEGSGITMTAMAGAANQGGAPVGGGATVGSDETLGQIASAMAGSGSPAAPVYGSPAQGGLSVDQLRAYLRASGISGTARVDVLQDGGSTIGDERLFTMATTVFLPGRSPFTSGPSAAMVPLAKVPRMAVGVELPVKVAPDNDRLVMFEWDRS